MLSDAFGGHIFGNLGVDGLLVTLAQLDDFFDALTQVALEQVFDLHTCLLTTTKSRQCTISPARFCAWMLASEKLIFRAPDLELCIAQGLRDVTAWAVTPCARA